jgi:hypothetical protein
MTKEQPEYFTDSDGRMLVRLPVQGSDAPALTEATLWNNAKRRRGLTGRLYMSGNGSGHRYVMASIEKGETHRSLAQLLLGEPRSYRVRFRDKDTLNHLPENFRLAAVWADEATAEKALALTLTQARGAPEVDRASA